jgi:hypothetical protein
MLQLFLEPCCHQHHHPLIPPVFLLLLLLQLMDGFGILLGLGIDMASLMMMEE